MAAHHIAVDAAVLGVEKKHVRIVINAATTAMDVVRSVVKECALSTMPGQYSLWMLINIGKEKPLQGTDKVLALISQQHHLDDVLFELRIRSSGVIRVYHQLKGDYQSFDSLIVTPKMSVRDVIMIILNKLMITDVAHNFILIEKGQETSHPLAPSECPLHLAYSSFELLSFREAAPLLKSDSRPEEFQRTKTSLHHLKRLTSVKVNKLPEIPSSYSSRTFPQPAEAKVSQQYFSSAGTLRPAAHRQMPSTQQPSVEVLQDQLLSKSDLIAALHTLSPTRRPQQLSSANVSRELILERALAEQNVILDTQQRVMNNLQQEVESHIQKICSQSETIQALSIWEPRAHAAQKRINELLSASQLSEQKLFAMEHSLSEKEEMIDSLLTKLKASPSSKLATLDSQLQTKRLKVMELEEEVHKGRRKLSITSQQLANKSGTLEVQASQIAEFKESISSLQRINYQQKEQITSLHSVLTEKDSTLARLNESLAAAEKHTSEMEKKLEMYHESPSQDLFSKLQERITLPVEVQRESKQASLGFKFTTVSTPVSMKAPRVIVTTSSLSSIEANDEILEVNGHLCSRSSEHTKALSHLKDATGMIKVVIAREGQPVSELQLKQANASISELETRLDSSRKMAIEQTEALTACEEELSCTKALLNSTNEGTAMAGKESAEMERLLQDAMEREKEAKAEIDQLQQQMDTQLCDSLASHKKLAKTYQEKFEKEKEQLVFEHLKDSQKAAIQIRDLTSENASLQGKLRELQAEVRQLSANLTSMQKDFLASSQENDANKCELLQTQQRLEMLTEKEKLLRQQVEESNAGLTKLKQASQESTASLTTQNQLLRDELARSQASMSEELDSAEKNVVEMKSIHLELDLQREKLLTSESTRSTLQQNIDSLQEQKASLLQQIESILEEKSTLTESLVSLEKSKMDIEKRLESKQSECSELHHELASLKKALQSSEEISAKLKDDLQAKLKDKDHQLTSSQQHVEKLLSERMSTSQEVLRLSEELTAMEEMTKIDKKTAEKAKSAVLEQLQQREEELATISIKKENQEKRLVELTAKLEFLQTEIAQQTSINDELKQTNDEYASSTAQLTSKLASTEKKLEEMMLELQTVQANLAASEKSLKSTETSCDAKVESIQKEINDVLGRLTESLVVRKQLEQKLKTQEDSVTALTEAEAQLQSECERLQHSLVSAETKATTVTEKHEELEKVYNELVITDQQLSDSEASLKTSLLSIQAEKEALVTDLATIKQQLEEERSKEIRFQGKIVKLQRSNAELNSTIEQLQTAQKALQASINSVGDEKDQEIVKLRDEATTVTEKLRNAKKALEDQVVRTCQVEKQLEASHNSKVAAENALSLLQHENSAIKEELATAQSTVSQMVGLKERISTLESSLQAKNDKLSQLVEQAQADATNLASLHAEKQELISQVSELANIKVSLAEKRTDIDHLQQQLSSVKGEFQQIQSERDELSREVAELATLKLALAEKETELQQLKHTLSEETKTAAHVKEERDQLMSTLRKVEVEKRTASLQKPPPQSAKLGSKQDLAKAVKELKDENWRLNEYIERLLQDILEKAPHVLEK